MVRGGLRALKPVKHIKRGYDTQQTGGTSNWQSGATSHKLNELSLFCCVISAQDLKQHLYCLAVMRVAMVWSTCLHQLWNVCMASLMILCLISTFNIPFLKVCSTDKHIHLRKKDTPY